MRRRDFLQKCGLLAALPVAGAASAAFGQPSVDLSECGVGDIAVISNLCAIADTDYFKAHYADEASSYPADDTDALYRCGLCEIMKDFYKDHQAASTKMLGTDLARVVYIRVFSDCALNRGRNIDCRYIEFDIVVSDLTDLEAVWLSLYTDPSAVHIERPYKLLTTPRIAVLKRGTAAWELQMRDYNEGCKFTGRNAITG